MNEILVDCINVAKRIRDEVLNDTMGVKKANTAIAANAEIINSYVADLRERMFGPSEDARNVALGRIEHHAD